MPHYTPIDVPKMKQERHVLTEEQKTKWLAVLDHFSPADFEIPGVEQGKLTEEEKFWITDECIQRYLRATKWDVVKAIQRLEETLKWRREFGLYDKLTPDYVEPESVTGKEIIFGYDACGRPAMYMIPSRQNTNESGRQLEFAFWMTERAIDLMGQGVESLDLMINFADKAKNPSLGTAHTMLSILQAHYPERMGLSLIINVPILVRAFFSVIMPFVDPVTRNKVKFNPNVFEDGFLTRDMVMKDWWGGDCEFEWDHSKYWPALISLCEARRKEQMEKWRALGAKVGISEWDFKEPTPIADIIIEKSQVAELPTTISPPKIVVYDTPANEIPKEALIV